MDQEELELKEELKRLKQDELVKRKKEREERLSKQSTMKQKQNSAIFVSNLSVENTKRDELISEFNKFGMIRRDLSTNDYKCKLYFDSTGNFKGEALIVYVRPESVGMAINMMDGFELNGEKIAVQEAVFSKKDSKEDELEMPTTKRRKLESEKEQAKQLDDWEDSDSQQDETYTVILGNVLPLYDDPVDDEEIREIERDVREGCEQIGKIIQFQLDKILGKAVLTFESRADALKCCNVMNGRFFDGRKIVAYMLKGDRDSPGDEDEDEENLDDFGDLIEG